MDTRYPGDTIMQDEGTLFDEYGDAAETTKTTRAFLTQHCSTLGERLAGEARRLVSRRIPKFLWLQLLETTIAHLAALPVPTQERFQRFDVLHHSASFPNVWNTRQTGSTSHSQTVVASRPFGDDCKADGQPFPSESQPVLLGGQPLQPYFQQRVQDFIGGAPLPIRVHDDEASYALAQARRADAVTIGQHIFFGRDHFRPQKDKGFALLAHEALHIVRAMQPDIAWRRATQSGIQEEEQEAAAIERQALATRRNASWNVQFLFDPLRLALPAQMSALLGRSALPRQRIMPDRASVSTASAVSTPAQQPMRAVSDRNIENSVIPPAVPDMETLKQALYRDLMRQIKVDMERGG